MNLMEGEMRDGTFTGENVRIEGLPAPDGPCTLGFRAEDASVAAPGATAGAQIEAPVYTMELLGDATMITVRAGGEMVAVKAGKEYRAEIGETVGINVPSAICHVFDRVTGIRTGEPVRPSATVPSDPVAPPDAEPEPMPIPPQMGQG